MDPSIDLKTILDLHTKWRIGDSSGRRADLSGANLCRADLYGADLCRADLCGADLCGADLRRANLRGADLRGTDLCGADLRHADLCDANLRGADLRRANLRGTDLCGADLRHADLCDAEGSTLALAMSTHLPDGPLHGWKKCANGILVKLLVPEDAKRSHGASRKCRCSKAIVLEVVGATEGISNYDSSVVYRVGEIVEPKNGWCEDRWETCAPGIHFFITRDEAEAYSE